MKKKLLTVFTAVIMCAVFIGAAACDVPDAEDTYYTVSFILNGGELSGQAASGGVRVKEGTELSLGGYLPTKVGNTFGGWKNGEETIAANGKITVNADITLEALWTAESYTVNFVLAGGAMTEESTVTVAYGETLDLSLYVPVFGLYEFCGWKNGDNVYALSDTVTVTENITLTAQWKLTASSAEMFVFNDLSDDTAELTGVSADFNSEAAVVPATTSDGKRITKIGNGAFRSNNTVKNIYLDEMEYLESIGDNAFAGCMNLEFVSLKGLSNLRTMGSSVFAGNYTAKTEKLQTVDFSGCTALESIGQMCFVYQDALISADFSDCIALKTIERQMFDNCSSLQTVSFPAGLQSIAENADFFRSCPSLVSIEVAAGNLYFESADGVMYTAGKEEIIKYPAASLAEAYVAPTSVTVVWGQAFENSENLTKIDFGGCKLTSVGFCAFEDCVNATVTVAFDQLGYYSDGMKCTLGSNWNKGIAEIIYGEKYYFFEDSFRGIEDGMVTAKETVTFSAAVSYGEYTCALTVENTTTGQSGTVADGQCVVSLQPGENVITVTARCEEKDKEETYSFTVTRNETLTVVSSLKKDGVNSVSDGYAFTVSVQDADGDKVDVNGKLSVAVDCGYSAPAYTSLINNTHYTVTYNTEGNVATVQLQFETLLMWDYAVDEPFNLKISYAVSSAEKLEAVYPMQYVPAPTLTIGGLEEGAEFSRSDTPAVTILAKEADGTAITSDRVSLYVNWGWGEQKFTFYDIVSEQDGTITVSLNCSSCSMYSMGEPFTLIFVINNADGTAVARQSFAVTVV